MMPQSGIGAAIGQGLPGARLLKQSVLVDDLQLDVVDAEGTFASLLEEYLYRAQPAVSVDLQDAAHAVLLVPHQQTHTIARPRSLLASLRFPPVSRRDRLGARSDAGLEPPLSGRRSAAPPTVHRPRHPGAVGLVDAGHVLGQLVQERARDGVQGLAAEVTQPGVTQIQFLACSRHADERQPPFLLDLVLAV